MRDTTTSDIDALIRLSGGRVPVLARVGAGLLPAGSASTWREARAAVHAHGLVLDGGGRPQVDELGGKDALVVRCRWQ